MKKKELMKFMAVMLSASMIAGSGVPVTAADFSADEIAVEAETEETQEETDEVQAETPSEESGTDASGLDFGDTFSNEEAVPAVGDDGTTDDAKTAQIYSFYNDTDRAQRVEALTLWRFTGKHASVVLGSGFAALENGALCVTVPPMETLHVLVEGV